MTPETMAADGRERIICKLKDNMNENFLDWSIDAWTVISALEFAVIMFLIFMALRRREPTPRMAAMKKNIISEKVDFGNILDSAFHAEELYEQLKVKCHPDRFIGDERKNAAALEIFQQLGQYRHDIKALDRIRQRAEDELDINF